MQCEVKGFKVTEDKEKNMAASSKEEYHKYVISSRVHGLRCLGNKEGRRGGVISPRVKIKVTLWRISSRRMSFAVTLVSFHSSPKASGINLLRHKLRDLTILWFGPLVLFLLRVVAKLVEAIWELSQG